MSLDKGKRRLVLLASVPRMFEGCIEMFNGYGPIDDLLEDCEHIGALLRAIIAPRDLKMSKVRRTAHFFGTRRKNQVSHLLRIEISK